MIRVENLQRYDADLIETLQQIRKRAEVALTQGALSRRNALQEIVAQAQRTLELE